MAETKTPKPKAKTGKPRPKKTAAAPGTRAAKAPAARAKAPAAKARAKRPAGKPKPAKSQFRRRTSSFNVADLIDHPLVADLLAVGAMAAVGAIADHNVKARTGETEAGSSKAVKAAGKAAAAAIGKRLLTEVEAIRTASKAKGTKPGSG